MAAAAGAAAADAVVRTEYSAGAATPTSKKQRKAKHLDKDGEKCTLRVVGTITSTPHVAALSHHHHTHLACASHRLSNMQLTHSHTHTHTHTHTHLLIHIHTHTRARRARTHAKCKQVGMKLSRGITRHGRTLKTRRFSMPRWR